MTKTIGITREAYVKILERKRDIEEQEHKPVGIWRALDSLLNELSAYQREVQGK